MISVIVVLSSAQTKKHYPLGSVTISNRGEIREGGLSDYDIQQISKNNKPVRSAEVLNHPREKVSVWKLVAKALAALGHAPSQEQESGGQMITVQTKQDGVWIQAQESGGKSALLNLNNVVNNMPKGIIREAFTKAIREQMEAAQTAPQE